MAATPANALKDYIESLGLGIAAYRVGDVDEDSEKALGITQVRYITILDGISKDAVSFGDNGVDGAVDEIMQVDIWQTWKDEDGRSIESWSLADDVQSLLNRAELVTAPRKVYGVKAPFARRLIEANNNVVHDAITVVLHRNS